VATALLDHPGAAAIALTVVLWVIEIGPLYLVEEVVGVVPSVV
jgi:hypothetical protein